MSKYMETAFLSGDIGLSRSEGFISKAIRFFTSWHTKDAWCNHAFGFVTPEDIVEAQARIAINPKKKYDGEQVRVYRIPLSQDERMNFKYGLLRRHNEAWHSYGYLKLPLFALDAICTKVSTFWGHNKPVFFFTKIFGISNIPVCSQLIVWALHTFTKYRLKDIFDEEVNWKCISPDYLDDLLQLDINQAKVIYETIDSNVSADNKRLCLC